MNTGELYLGIAERTGGDIYIGVVGPVRTGKSTFIKRVMDLAVLPNVADANVRLRMTDELPQSGGGLSVMTTQPTFVPAEAAEVTVGEGAQIRMRLVDCVGYLIDGAQGIDENGEARMVRTPWFDYDIPFEQAAEIGTRKVIRDHATIGIVLTTDGSVTDFPREAYEASEARAVRELKALGKPFAVLINTADPQSTDVLKLKEKLAAAYQVPVMAANVQQMDEAELNALMESVLYEFPLTEVVISAPAWMMALKDDHPVAMGMLKCAAEAAEGMSRMRDIDKLRAAFDGCEYVESLSVEDTQLAEGALEVRISPPKELFYQVLSEASGQSVEGEEHLMTLMCELAFAKREYDRVSEALRSVRATGYGLVPPQMSELMLEEPELVKQGNRFGVKLKASAPSLHLIRVDIQTEVNPIVGTEQQSEDMVQYLMSGFESDPDSIWESNMFGKTLNELVREGLSNKLMRMPEDVRGKVRDTLQKIINEGNGGMLCILL